MRRDLVRIAWRVALASSVLVACAVPLTVAEPRAEDERPSPDGSDAPASALPSPILPDVEASPGADEDWVQIQVEGGLEPEDAAGG